MARLDLTGASEMAPTSSLDETLFQLGIANSTGQSGEADLIAAHKWFNLAAMQGNDDAARYRQEIAMEMTTSDIAQAQRAAREWIHTR